MIVHVHPLNADTSFLITITEEKRLKPLFTIVIDPWLFGDSPTYHRLFSNQFHTIPAHIDSLLRLDPAPDVVLVSQNKTDHCHEDTLRELPSTAKIFAVKDAHSTIKSWKHFEDVTVINDYRQTKKENFIKFPGGEIALASLPASGVHEITGLHSALSLRISREAADGAEPEKVHIIYSAHGIPASALKPLLPAGSTIDLLLHPCVRVSMPFWLGGDVSMGYSGVQEIVKRYKVKNIVGVHDEVKIVTGFVKWFMKLRGLKGELPKGTRLWEMCPEGWELRSGGGQVGFEKLGGDWRCCGETEKKDSMELNEGEKEEEKMETEEERVTRDEGVVV